MNYNGGRFLVFASWFLLLGFLGLVLVINIMGIAFWLLVFGFSN